ncbi:MAG: protein kinase domain-containing protein [Candidatus Binatia bacterium]
MASRFPSSSCGKCGRPVPPSAGFCPNCGTQIGEPKFHDAPDTPEIMLRETPGGPVTSLPTSTPTIDLSKVVTSLDSPSPPPRIRPGDGPFQAGQQIGPRYTILKLLGTGGMGAVYQAFDHELGVAVAIKVIRPSAQSDATAAKELEQRFKRELVLARQVTHKYVVRIHDLGEIDGIKYLTMPFVEGETLAQILRRTNTLPLGRVITIAQQIAHGLEAAHEKGVVHRDLKPENIMIERAADDPMPYSGDALIMDFGIARSVEGGATQTAAGSVIGTLEYMAPEQAQGLKVDQRADQYAFGLIVYDMLVGRQRFAGRDNAMTELLSRISKAPSSPRALNPEIPEALDRLVIKCLQPSPDARFASTRELVDALDHLTPDGQVRSDVHEVIVHDSAPRPKWLADLLRRYPWLATLTLVLAVLLALLAILFAPAVGLSLLIFALTGGLFYLYRIMRDILRQLSEPQIFTDQGQTPAAVDAAPKSPDFRLAEPGDSFQPRVGTVDNQTAINFKAALKDMYTANVAARQAAFEAPKQVLDMPMLTSTLVANLHPYRTVPRLVLDRILLPERFRLKFIPELFDEVMNYPEFDIPMYKPLADLSSEYFLPNINLIEQNSIILLETNQKFIESYMVGLNHEMSRELLWREYPTDMRGSYFRQFWDVSGYLPQTGENLDGLKEKLKDIPELHRWSLTSALGDHDNREQGGAKEEEVVLVIRGELLKKYPTAVIYAHKAKWQTKNKDGSGGIDNTKERLLADIPAGQEDNPPRDILKTPLYSAKVEPDIYFFGFDLTSVEAKGSDGSHPGDENKPCWYFVIKERPGEPRFGLDIGGPNAEKHTWSDLGWEDAAPGLADGGFLSITNATAAIGLTAPTDTSQAEFAGELEQYKEDKLIAWSKDADAADLAYILYQVPVMVAVHASEMLQ